MSRVSAGTVHPVGAGPVNPGLLTLRAHGLSHSAELILYEILTSAEVLAFARKGADRRYVDGNRAKHARTQSEINAAVVKAGQQGFSAVRLKGADLYVFGKGGEEV